MEPRTEPPRLSEILGALASTADLANGFPLGKVLRTAILAVRVSRAAGLGDATAADAYLLTQLRYLGCTGFTHDEAHRYGAGDDVSVRNTMALADVADKLGTLRRVVRGIAPGASVFRKTAAIARLLSGDAVTRHASSQCNAAIQLGRMIGVSPPILVALETTCERWDGLGAPRRLRGDAIPMAMRVHSFSDTVEIAHHRGGLAGAIELVKARRGGQFDPALADAFLRDAPEIGAALATTTLWEDFLEAESEPAQTVTPEAFDATAKALGYFADLKSVFLLGHSQRVAELAAKTAAELGLSGADQRIIARAGHLHDLGRVAVPTGTWDRPGPLGVLEWEQVRLHTYHTDRVLALSPALAELRPIAGSAHERSQGDGYHRGLVEAHLPLAARVVAVCDAIVAMGERRAHRDAKSADAIRAQIESDVRERRHDRRIAEAALHAAGLIERRSARAPAGLSDREVEVLVLVARGKTNKEIATLLGISAKTVQHHVAHVYDKIGAYSRAGAAIFAMEQRLLD